MSLDSHTLDAAAEIVKTIGFPIVVACWFMFRTDKKIDENTAALTALRDELHEGKK